MEKLYCVLCDKTHDVRAEDIALMRQHARLPGKTEQGYRFEAGCFFKMLARVKRESRTAQTLSR